MADKISFIFQLEEYAVTHVTHVTVVFVYQHGHVRVHIDQMQHKDLLRYLDMLEPFLVRNFLENVSKSAPSLPGWTADACTRLLRAFIPKELMNSYQRRGRRALGHKWFTHRQQAMYSKYRFPSLANHSLYFIL